MINHCHCGRTGVASFRLYRAFLFFEITIIVRLPIFLQFSVPWSKSARTSDSMRNFMYMLGQEVHHTGQILKDWEK